MMEKAEERTIKILTNGLIIRSDPSLLREGELQECMNYEFLEKGTLKKQRTDYPVPEDIPAGLGNIAKLALWKARNLPDGAGSIKDYLLLLYTDNKKLWLLHHTGSAWDSSLKSGATCLPVFTDLEKPSLSECDYGIALVDGRDNNIGKFIEIDADNKVIYGDIGLKSPLGLPSVSGAAIDNKFADDDSYDTGMGIEQGAILFVAITQVTKNGIESNPSPIFVYTDLNYLYKDADYNLEKYWVRTLIKKMRTIIADESGHDGLKDQLKHFNLYLASVPYVEGDFARGDLQRARQVLITNKTGNNESMCSDPFAGALINYERDLACKGDDICSGGDVLFVGNANTQIRFPFEFQYCWFITAANKNGRFYSRRPIRIRLKDTDMKDKDGNQVFLWNDAAITSGDSIVSTCRPKLRIYEADNITPVPVDYVYSDGNTYIDIWIPPSYMKAEGYIPLYLCYAGNKDGVPAQSGSQTDFRTYKYGKWFNARNGLLPAQEVFQPNRVRDSNNLVCCSNESHGSDNCRNRADGGSNLLFLHDTEWVTFYCEYVHLTSDIQRILEYSSTDNKNFIKTGDTGFNVLSGANADIEDISCKRLQFMGYVVAKHDTVSATVIVFPIVFFDGTDAKWIKLTLSMDPATDNGTWSVETSSSGGVQIVRTHSIHTVDTNKFFVNFNVDIENDKITLYIYDVTKTGEFADYLDVDKAVTMPNDFVLEDINFSHAMNQDDPPTVYYSGYSQIQVHRETYLNSADKFEYRQHMNFSPYFPEEWIGWHEGDSENKNITIEPAIEIKYDSPKGMTKYSESGGRSFPDNYYVWASGPTMRILPSPSFLHNGEYINSILIFGWNGERQRFILQDKPSEWKGKVQDLLVRELSKYGLAGREAVLMIGDTLYALTPAGFIQEDKRGRVILTDDEEGETRIKITLDEMKDAKILYNPMDKQIIIMTRFHGINYEDDDEYAEDKTP